MEGDLDRLARVFASNAVGFYWFLTGKERGGEMKGM